MQYAYETRRVSLTEQELNCSAFEAHEFTPFLVRFVLVNLLFYVLYFVDHCLSFCASSFCQYAVKVTRIERQIIAN